MKPKNMTLIRYLLEAPNTTANSLADRLHVSTRSVKNYVQEINREYPGCISSSREGYSVSATIAKQIIDESQSRVPQSSHERVTFILNNLMNHSNSDPINVYDLCDDMYVSLSTLKNELQKVKRRLAKFDLELLMQQDEVSVKGLEKNKRKMLSTILYDESNVNFVNLNSIQKAFIDIGIDFIKNSVLEIFDEYHYFINDYSLINLVLHITISVDRIRNDNFNTQDVSEQPGVRLHEYELAQKVTKRLEQYFNIKYSEAEVYEMTLLIISRTTTIDYNSINSANLEQFIGKECLDLVYQLIQDISAFYYIDLSEQEFLIRFALHIRNLLVRSKNNYFSKNPLTEGIKTSCPLIYDVSVTLASTMKEKTGVSINDDEIAYIAFHLGSAIEAQKSLTTKVTAVLYCPNYYDMNLRINDTINQHFANDILIKNILTDESEFEKLNEIDMVITTIPISTILTIPIIQINLFLSDRDRFLLQDRIEEIRKQKAKNEFENYLRDLINPDFFERKNGLQSEKDCIDYMVKKMVKLGYVDNNFKKQIYEREQMSSTAFGNFAIPHAMKMYAHKTGMNIIVSDEPILWNNCPVNLVIMLCFNINERYIFNEIFDPITMILSESDNIKKICSSKNYEQFIQNMVSLL